MTRRTSAATAQRALTIALDAALSVLPVTSPAIRTSLLAHRALMHLPPGWTLQGPGSPDPGQALLGELRVTEGRLRDAVATQRLLLAFRIREDGHAASLREAAEIAHDLSRVTELYPDLVAALA